MLKYKVVSRKNPLNSDVKWYSQLATPDVVDIDKISEMIAQNCTLTRHDIVACLSAFQEQLINALEEGKSVHLADLGSFRLTMHSVGSPTQEAFTSSLISRLTIRFVPAVKLRKRISVGMPGIKFQELVEKTAPPGALSAASVNDSAGNEDAPVDGNSQEAGTGI